MKNTDISPMERRARSEVRDRPEILRQMTRQHRKGREAYGHPIDEWQADPLMRLKETAAEAADLITYLVALEAPPEVFAHLREVTAYLDTAIHTRRTRRAGRPRNQP